MERLEYNKVLEMAKNITDYLKGRTGNNFQNDMYIILKEYYSHFHKTFEMPEAMNGDYKNDGWVIEDKIYFIMYAPVIVKKSFYKDIQNKLLSDLDGLLKNICEEQMWGKELRTVIMLVNTKDKRLPPDNTREYENIITNYKNKYNIEFNYKITNLDYIQDIISELPIEVLDKIMFKLNMARSIDYNEPNATDIMNTISTISKTAVEFYTHNLSSDYHRISTYQKIKINNLEPIKEEIDLIISKLGVLNTVINEMSQDMTHLEQFECTKNYIISKYIENMNKYSGVELFNCIIEEILNLFPYNDKINEIKYLVVYIFDKCDIFEKEVS